MHTIRCGTAAHSIDCCDMSRIRMKSPSNVAHLRTLAAEGFLDRRPQAVVILKLLKLRRQMFLKICLKTAHLGRRGNS